MLLPVMPSIVAARSAYQQPSPFVINLTPCSLTVKKDALHTSVAPFVTCKFLHTVGRFFSSLFTDSDDAAPFLSLTFERNADIPLIRMLGWSMIDNDGNKHVRQCFENCHTPKPPCALAGTLCQRRLNGKPPRSDRGTGSYGNPWRCDP